MAKPQNSTALSYLHCREKSGRVKLLTSMLAAGEQLPISLVDDLLKLDLSLEEKQALLNVADRTDNLAYEHFLTATLAVWPQELATTALYLWRERTDHLLWFRLLQVSQLSFAPQRVRYTILDHAFYAGGARLIEAMATMPGLDDMSPAFQCLLLLRAVQWNTPSTQLKNLSVNITAALQRDLHPEIKSLPAALIYLARYSPTDLEALCKPARPAALAIAWYDLVQALQLSRQANDWYAACQKILQKPLKSQAIEKLTAAWPLVWQRHDLDAITVGQAVTVWLTQELKSPRPKSQGPTTNAEGDFNWEFFAGVPAPTLITAIGTLTDDQLFATAAHRLCGLLPQPLAPALATEVKERLRRTDDPAALLARLPLRWRLQLTDTSSGAFDRLRREEQAALSKTTPGSLDFPEQRLNDAADATNRVDAAYLGEDSTTIAKRREFFNLAYPSPEGSKTRQTATTSTPRPEPASKAFTPPSDPLPQFWSLLIDAWHLPNPDKLTVLAASARQISGVFRLCYLKALGRFHGLDAAALKLLDFTRSKEEDDMRAVIQSLGSIGTPRATQELIAALTRPNTTFDLQMEICALLQKHDCSNLQNELHSAINDLIVDDKTADRNFEIREAIASLLSPANADAAAGLTRPTPPTLQLPASGINDQQLDATLDQKIPHYRELSSEVKRALRTALFFHIQVSGNAAPGAIDLSPVIDMQYKALELLFRENFEETCSQVIQHGVLQRRLDVLGYARPIPRAMDDFEAYIAALPIVRDIPFFSKFKLRKMLRAICQFRPGKRFTLDGLKAFSLFFLCFSRRDCRYGLALQLPLGFASDQELFHYCKQMHILQDFRNRAAHEGFHPDAASDIESIWRTTADIVKTMHITKTFVDNAASRDYAPRNTSQPIIERKVS